MPIVPLEDIAFVGSGLLRPECVLAHRSGLLFAADWTGHGGVAIVDPATGAVSRHLSRRKPVKPNGLLLEDSGTILLTHLGATDGGVFRLHPDGDLETVLSELDGAPIPPSNFTVKDRMGRLYVTVSTRLSPRHKAAHSGARDGFIVMKPPVGRPRIVADNLGYANEAVFSADGGTLYVNETFARETSAFAVSPDGTLGKREVVAAFGAGIYPDGLALDAEGGLWITSIISNTVLRLRPDGRREVVLEDRDASLVETVERRYQSGLLDRVLLDTPHLGPLKNISSLAFGGPDLSTAYLGCLLGDSIARFESPVAGERPSHFGADLTPLARAGRLPEGFAL